MVMLSPGVRTRELDYSTYVGQISTSILGMVGGATKGPLDKPTFVSSPEDFFRKFGEPVEDELATFCAIQFLREGNMMYYVRVGDGDEAKASVTIDDGAAEVEEDVLEIEALSEGTWGDNISVEIANVDGTVFDLIVKYKEQEVEKYLQVSLDDDDEDYVEDATENSSYIYVEDLKEGEGTDIDEDTFDLSGGNNGIDGLEDADYIGTLENQSGLEAYSDTEEIDINILAVPARSANASVATKIIAICESRGDCIGIIDPPFGYSAQEVVDWHNGDGTGASDPASALNSSYAATYWSWLKIYDPWSRKEIWVPPSGFVTAQFAYNDREGYPWFAPAGFRRGRIVRALDIEDSPNKGTRNLLYGNQNAINPIVNFSRDGITIWGQRTLQRRPSALDRVNVRRLLLMIRKAIAISTAYFVFEPNDFRTWDEWRGMVEPYLEGLKNSRAFYDYYVKMDEDTVTPVHIDRNEMPGYVYVQPTKAAEFIRIDFIILPTGADFPDN